MVFFGGVCRNYVGQFVFICFICWLGMFRYRHLMLNLVDILPHSKKDNKVESKGSKGTALNELVELKNCSSCLFFEVCSLWKCLNFVEKLNSKDIIPNWYTVFSQCRKGKDLYLWMSKCPNGPSVKFLVNAGKSGFTWNFRCSFYGLTDL